MKLRAKLASADEAILESDNLTERLPGRNFGF
jgi:hypothetical protein